MLGRGLRGTSPARLGRGPRETNPPLGRGSRSSRSYRADRIRAPAAHMHGSKHGLLARRASKHRPGELHPSGPPEQSSGGHAQIISAAKSPGLSRRAVGCRAAPFGTSAKADPPCSPLPRKVGRPKPRFGLGVRSRRWPVDRIRATGSPARGTSPAPKRSHRPLWCMVVPPSSPGLGPRGRTGRLQRPRHRWDG